MELHLAPVVRQLYARFDVTLILPESIRGLIESRTWWTQFLSDCPSLKVHWYSDHQGSIRGTCRSFREFANSALRTTFDYLVVQGGLDYWSRLILRETAACRRILWFPLNHLLLQHEDYVTAFDRSGSARYAADQMISPYRSKSQRIENLGRSLALVKSFYDLVLFSVRHVILAALIPRSVGLKTLALSKLEIQTGEVLGIPVDAVFVNSSLAGALERNLRPKQNVFVIDHPARCLLSQQGCRGRFPARGEDVLVFFAGLPDLHYVSDIQAVVMQQRGSGRILIKPHPNASESDVNQLLEPVSTLQIPVVVLDRDASISTVLAEYAIRTVIGTASSALHDVVAISPDIQVFGVWPSPESRKASRKSNVIAHPLPPIQMGERVIGESGVIWIRSDQEWTYESLDVGKSGAKMAFIEALAAVAARQG